MRGIEASDGKRIPFPETEIKTYRIKIKRPEIHPAVFLWVFLTYGLSPTLGLRSPAPQYRQQPLEIPIPPQQNASARIGAREQGLMHSVNCLSPHFPQPQKTINRISRIIQVQLHFPSEPGPLLKLNISTSSGDNPLLQYSMIPQKKVLLTIRPRQIGFRLRKSASAFNSYPPLIRIPRKCGGMLSSRLSAPYMTHGQIEIQKLPDLLGKRTVVFGQTHGKVLMYRRFTDSHFFCGCAKRRFVFEDIFRFKNNSFIDCFFHTV